METVDCLRSHDNGHGYEGGKIRRAEIKIRATTAVEQRVKATPRKQHLSLFFKKKAVTQNKKNRII